MLGLVFEEWAFFICHFRILAAMAMKGSKLRCLLKRLTDPVLFGTHIPTCNAQTTIFKRETIVFLPLRGPARACDFVCVCFNGKSLGPWHSVSTCLDSMWSPGPAHCSQTLLLLFTTLPVKWKTPACRSTCRLISRHSLAARKHVLQWK